MKMPLDFTKYLSERLGLSESDANRVLGTWLKEYEPVAPQGHDTPSHVASAAGAACSVEPATLAQTA